MVSSFFRYWFIQFDKICVHYIVLDIQEWANTVLISISSLVVQIQIVQFSFVCVTRLFLKYDLKNVVPETVECASIYLVLSFVRHRSSDN